MNNHPRHYTNPQRRERLVNLADFRRTTATEPEDPQPLAEELPPQCLEETGGDEAGGAASQN